MRQSLHSSVLHELVSCKLLMCCCFFAEFAEPSLVSNPGPLSLSAGWASTLLGGDGRSGGSPALPRKQQPREKSPGGLLEDPQDVGTFTRDRKTGFFSSFIKKKSSSSSSSSSPSSQLQQNLPTPPKRSSSFREMETQPHKKYEPTPDFSAPPPQPHSDGLGGFSSSSSPSPSHSHGEPAQPQARCCGAAFGQKPSAAGFASQVASGSSWSGLAGFFTPRLIKRTLGLRTGKTASSEEAGSIAGGPKAFPRSNSTSSMASGLPDLERMALTLPRNRSAKPPLERTASTTSQPENGGGRPSEALLRRMDEGTAQIRERPKAKLLPRGASATAGVRAPGVGGEVGDSESPPRVKEGREEGGGVLDRQQSWSSPSKASGSMASSAPAAGAQTHNHKVPVLISPTLKHHSPADVHLVGLDSQGNRFRLLSEHQAERDRPRLVKPKCAPPPPPTLRSLQQAYSGDGEEQVGGAPAEVNGDSLRGHRSLRMSGGAATGRPAVPPPQVPPVTSSSFSPSCPGNANPTPIKMGNGAAVTAAASFSSSSSSSHAAPSAGSKVALRRTRQQAERAPLERANRMALLECAECLSSALHASSESPSSSQVLDAGHQLLDYCSGYVDCIPQTRNKFAFREAVGKLELSLQELRASSCGGGVLGGVGPPTVQDNLHSCIKEISDLVQR